MHRYSASTAELEAPRSGALQVKYELVRHSPQLSFTWSSVHAPHCSRVLIGHYRFIWLIGSQSSI